MAGSVYPSVQYGETVVRGHIPGFAASDIVAGAPVCLASSGDWSFKMCASSNDKPVGIARNSPKAGQAVSVLDDFNIVRTNVLGNGAGASFPRQAFLGVVGTSTVTHPQSAVSVTFGVLGQVTGTPSLAVGASAAATWAVGVAYESAAAGDYAAFRVEPRLLSGQVLS